MFEFNPKGGNLIDQELSISGIYHSIDLGNILSFGAKDRNEQRKKAEKKQRKLAREQRDDTNEYYEKLDAADRKNYTKERNFSHKTLMKDWEYGKEIHKFNRNELLRQYRKSQSIGNKQLELNKQAEQFALDQEIGAMQDLFMQQQFQRRSNLTALSEVLQETGIAKAEAGIQLEGIRSRKEFGQLAAATTVKQLQEQSAMDVVSAQVEGLVAEGATALRQAGRSTEKGQQSNMAALHRNLMSLESELSGKYKQAAIQLAEIQADTSLAEFGVGLNIERIENTIESAQEEFAYNSDVMQATLDSAMKQAETNIKQIALDRQFADLNTKAGMMLKPKKVPYRPKPKKPPKRIFVDRLKVKAGYVPPAIEENLFMAGVQGVGQIASTVGSVVGAVSGIGDLGSMFGKGGDTAGAITRPGEILGTSNVPTPQSYLQNSPTDFTGGTNFAIPSQFKTYGGFNTNSNIASNLSGLSART